MAVRCARCGMLSPDRSQRCDCGYDFVTSEMGPPHESVARARAAATRHLVRGGALLAGALPFASLMLYLGMVTSSLIPLMLGGLGLIVGVVGGATSLVTGVHQRRQLRAGPGHALPAARIVSDR